MTPIGWIILAICIFAGFTIGAWINKNYPNFFDKFFSFFNRDKRLKEVLNNPHLLVEKFKESGKIYDMGKELDIKVGKDSKTGQDIVVVEEIPSKKAKKIQKQITKKTEKKKLKPKKKVKKK